MGLVDRLGLCLSIAAHMLGTVCGFGFCVLLSRLFVL
nr:MAG TPA: hypothetical protein [Caudoviricetes sp.]